MAGPDVPTRGLLVGGAVVLGTAILSIKALLLTVLILAVPFGVWWAVDHARRTRPAGPPGAWPGATGPGPFPGAPFAGARGTATFATPPATGAPRPAPPGPALWSTGGATPPGTSRYPAPPAPPRPAASAGPSLLPAEVQVTVTREQDHQDVLARRAPPGADARAAVVVELASSTIGRGKHAGRYGIEVRLGGARVGELTAAMSERYADLVRDAERQGRPARAEGVVTRGARGLQVDLRLPGRT